MHCSSPSFSLFSQFLKFLQVTPPDNVLFFSYVFQDQAVFFPPSLEFFQLRTLLAFSLPLNSFKSQLLPVFSYPLSLPPVSPCPIGPSVTVEVDFKFLQVLTLDQFHPIHHISQIPTFRLLLKRNVHVSTLLLTFC